MCDGNPLLSEGVSSFSGLVVACGVDGVLGEDLAGGAVDDHGVRYGGEQGDRVVPTLRTTRLDRKM